MVIAELALGGLGGLARSCVGLIKALRNDVDINWKYTISTVFSSAIIGMVAGFLFDSNYKMSLVSGYIGMDLLESVYKIYFRKNIY